MVVKHLFLVKGTDFNSATSRVNRFIRNYKLIGYEKVEVKKDQSFNAKSPEFFDFLKKGIDKNKKILKQIIEELISNNFDSLKSLINLPQGHLSKQLHTVAHFLDGFLGIDSYFYNIEEDSHWVSDDLIEAIKRNPSNFWVISIKAYILSYHSMFEQESNLNPYGTTSV